MRVFNRKRKRDCGGQAMVEMVAALIAILVLTAGLLQVIGLGKTHTDCMVQARSDAGRKAISSFAGESLFYSDPDYIGGWEEGPDGKRHTRDDKPVRVAPAEFNSRIVERSVKNESEWKLIERSPDDSLPGMRYSPNPSVHFGLVRGYSSEEVPLLPAVRHFLYRASSVEVESEVWMTKMGEIY
ncbi:MAG: hypothetical protein R6V03_10305 [Kiritimatiellia bacterium]